jgi:ATP-binding cassette subfamily B protein
VWLALLLAIINQVFSLLDPLIFRHIIDNVATKFTDKNSTFQDFVGAILPLLGASVGVAFVSRVAKNFQDYFINTITQKIGAEMYADGIRHSLELPYETFEDQRSGETLGKLQKVRVDVEKLISSGINIFFQSLVALVFVTIYAVSVHWSIVPLFLTIGLLLVGLVRY